MVQTNRWVTVAHNFNNGYESNASQHTVRQILLRTERIGTGLLSDGRRLSVFCSMWMAGYPAPCTARLDALCVITHYSRNQH